MTNQEVWSEMIRARNEVDRLRVLVKQMRSVAYEAALYCSPMGEDASDMDAAIETLMGKPVDEITPSDLRIIATMGAP